FYGRPSTNSTIRLSPPSDTTYRSLRRQWLQGWRGRMRQQRTEPVDLSLRQPVIPPLRNGGRLVYGFSQLDHGRLETMWTEPARELQYPTAEMQSQADADMRARSGIGSIHAE
ncbi:hypothetical protein, partial [Mesorhizobium sp.]|uniref:hypothetical protein n=1 Tax=Mesorhizobium sp. TaxID=1871066 RepID=UPI0025CC2FEE